MQTEWASTYKYPEENVYFILPLTSDTESPGRILISVFLETQLLHILGSHAKLIIMSYMHIISVIRSGCVVCRVCAVFSSTLLHRSLLETCTNFVQSKFGSKSKINDSTWH